MRYIILIVVLSVAVALLRYKFPYVLNGDGDMMRVTYLSLLIAVVAGGYWASGRHNMLQVAKYAFVWLAIIMGLVLAYSYRDQLQWQRLKAELMPNQIQMTAEGGLSVRSGADGHFHIEAELEGVPVSFLVDTGASDIVLAPRDAERMGYSLGSLEYTRVYNTANGTGSGAPVVIDRFRVGVVTFRQIPASVNAAEMDESLLGMAFLRQFKSFTVDGDMLTLYPW